MRRRRREREEEEEREEEYLVATCSITTNSAVVDSVLCVVVSVLRQYNTTLIGFNTRLYIYIVIYCCWVVFC